MKTAEKVVDWKGGGADQVEALGEALRQHTLAGEKSVALYLFGSASRDTILNTASNLPVQQSTAAQIYPCLLEDEALADELAFGTTTASLKHEKMRRAGLDLRKEIYHQGGKAALSTPIEPHKVSIVWHLNEGDYAISKPELTLSCDSRIANGENPIVTQVAIRKCRGEEDYNFVRNRLLAYLAE